MTENTLLGFKLGIKNCIDIIATFEQARLLFLSFSMLSFLCIVMMIFQRDGSTYHSETMKITNTIRTPVPAGQYQNGSARWQSKKEIRTNFKNVTLDKGEDIISRLLTDKDIDPTKSIVVDNAGLVIGMKKYFGKERIQFIGEDEHTLCIGSTRSGKSRGIVLQSIGLIALSGQSIISTDPKAELYHFTAPYLEKLGYEVITLDFKDPLKSQRYNFLQPIIDMVNKKDIAKACEYAWDLTSILVGESNGEKIWHDGECSVIASCVLAVVYENRKSPQFQNLANVYMFINEMCLMTEKEPPIAKYLATLSDDHPAKTLMGIANVAPARTRGSFYTSALSTLRLFTSHLIADMTSTSDFDPKDIGEKKQALFIILPDEKKTYYPLASLFIAQSYQMLVTACNESGGRLKRNVNILVDEFGNFSKMPDLTSMVSVGAGRGIRYNFFVQSLSQIVEKYGKEASETIKGNCMNTIYLRSEDLSTLEELSKKLGTYTVGSNSKSSSYSHNSSSNSSVSVSLTGRACSIQ